MVCGHCTCRSSSSFTIWCFAPHFWGIQYPCLGRNILKNEQKIRYFFLDVDTYEQGNDIRLLQLILRYSAMDWTQRCHLFLEEKGSSAAMKILQLQCCWHGHGVLRNNSTSIHISVSKTSQTRCAGRKTQRPASWTSGRRSIGFSIVFSLWNDHIWNWNIYKSLGVFWGLRKENIVKTNCSLQWSWINLFDQESRKKWIDSIEEILWDLISPEKIITNGQ